MQDSHGPAGFPVDDLGGGFRGFNRRTIDPDMVALRGICLHRTCDRLEPSLGLGSFNLSLNEVPVYRDVFNIKLDLSLHPDQRAQPAIGHGVGHSVVVRQRVKPELGAFPVDDPVVHAPRGRGHGDTLRLGVPL